MVLFLQLQDQSSETTKNAPEFNTTPKDPGIRFETLQKTQTHELITGQQTSFTPHFVYIKGWDKELEFNQCCLKVCQTVVIKKCSSVRKCNTSLRKQFQLHIFSHIEAFVCTGAAQTHLSFDHTSFANRCRGLLCDIHETYMGFSGSEHEMFSFDNNSVDYVAPFLP